MWEAYRKKKQHILIGIMSGTSLDGVDAAMVRIDTNTSGSIDQIELLGFEYIPYSVELKERLISLCSVEHARLDDLVIANYGISEWYVSAVENLLKSTGIERAAVEAISMHGQTVWHAPDQVPFPVPDGQTLVKATLQIGEAAVVRERTGIPVIGNLRARDMAAGGEGAPLAPYLDLIVFRSQHVGRIVQNIGGIGNATVIPAGAHTNECYAFDTGPGNMVMDTLVREETNGQLQYDTGGEIAAKGHVNDELVESFYKNDDYYEKVPPKSTGREVYGSAFAARFRDEGRKRGLTFEDIIASATALTAMTIVRSYQRFVFPIHKIGDVIVAGGGAHNKTLLAMMRKSLAPDCQLHTSENFGIPDDAREAIAFAVMGHESLMGRPSNLPAVTGAARPVILGQITL
ncbi:anhydro-N-acetylmuramic acid kinase [Paenibacillus sp. LMG 31456]|uniref:Anhydro-N-acetylmuramic acid kinase n=2 Tax=Paenibacillus foliorum TaxID=2654974 RepID=A0A972K2B6_9BACL|nr:anhydro-N-acetylmuramic acid kinase [Paenibacillus foliorum]